MAFFRVEAFRWGWTNNSGYHVWAGTDKSSAIAHANSESHSRGGKYGCTVYEMEGEEEKPIYHSPSAYGESKAHMNWRLELFRTIGGMVVTELECDKYPPREDVEKRIALEKKTNEIFADKAIPEEKAQFETSSA